MQGRALVCPALFYNQTMKKTLSSIKIEEKVVANMKFAIEKYNSYHYKKINQKQFRELSYEIFSQIILQDIKLPLEI